MIAGFNYVKICDTSSREFNKHNRRPKNNNIIINNNSNRIEFLLMIHIHEYAEEERWNERYGISFSRHTDSSLIYTTIFYVFALLCLLLYIYILIHSHYGPMLVIKLMLTHIHSFSRFFFYFSFLCSPFSFNIELYFVVAETAFICWIGLVGRSWLL